MAHVLFLAQGYESLAVEYLSAWLKQAGHRTSLVFDPVLFDESGMLQVPALARFFDERQRVVDEVLAARPDLVGITVLSDNHPWARDLARRIKQVRPDLPIVLGGIHPTSVPERVMDNPDIDYACVGDGEEALLELCERLDGARPWAPIPNLWERHQGQLVRTSPRPPREDLDSLPWPDKDLFYDKSPHFRHGYTIMTARGCPYACTFCNNNVLRQLYRGKGQYLRRRSGDDVLAELHRAVDRWQPRFVHFLDDVFVRQPDWLLPFLDRYRDEIGLPFFGFASPQHINPTVARALARAGCYKIQMGVQTVQESYRHKTLWRGHSNQHILDAIAQLRAQGIYVTCDNILGLPGHDLDEARDLLRFYAESPADHHEVFWLRYYPKTRIVQTAQELGALDEDDLARIEDSVHVAGIARGGDSFDEELARVQLSLNLYPWLPQPARRALVDRDWFQRLPALSPMTITIGSRIVNHARYDVWQGRAYRRYAVYTARHLHARVRRGLQARVRRRLRPQEATA